MSGPAPGGALPRFVVRYIAVAVTALLVVSVIATNAASQDRAATIHASQIAACHRGNELRAVLAGFFHHQLVQAEHVSYSQFFPATPKQRLHRLRRQQIHYFARAEHKAAPLTCHTLYPAP